jgi:hypothetical protein
MRLTMNQEAYLELRSSIETYFTDANRDPDSTQTHVSPSGLFNLEISGYATKPDAWNYSRGVVRDLNNVILADVKRNYSSFWYTWIQHPNGCEYLLCGEDYQGYSVINLTKGTTKVYFPDEGYGGTGFCWTAVYPSPDNLVLAVDGCYWACPYEIVFYDFTDPERLPLLELGRLTNTLNGSSWLDNQRFNVMREVEFRLSDDTAYESLSEAEQEILDHTPNSTGSRKEERIWSRTNPTKDTHRF